MRKPPPISPSPRLQLHNVIVNDAIQHCWQNRWDEVRSVADLESVSRLDRVHERLNTLRSSHAARTPPPFLTDTSLLRHREFPRRCVPHSDAIEREPLGYAARPSANCLASALHTGWTVNRASFSYPKRTVRCRGFVGGSADRTETCSRGYDPSSLLRRASKLCPECTITRRSVSVRTNDATRASTSNPRIARDRSPLGSRVHNDTSMRSPGSNDASTALAMRCANPFLPKNAMVATSSLQPPGSSRALPGHRLGEPGAGVARISYGDCG